MPKQKTHRGAKKRFKVTGGGKVLRHHSMHSHILTKKTTKRKRGLDTPGLVSAQDQKQIDSLLPNK